MTEIKKENKNTNKKGLVLSEDLETRKAQLRAFAKKELEENRELYERLGA